VAGVLLGSYEDALTDGETDHRDEIR